VFEEFLVGVGEIVVGDGDRLDLRRSAFKGPQIGAPRVGTAELIVEDGARCMDMRLPSMPLRAAIDHLPSPNLFSELVWFRQAPDATAGGRSAACFHLLCGVFRQRHYQLNG
jgi:hypothetical protein